MAGERQVLVVEDDEATRDAMSMVLEVIGYKVTVASNGQEALARLRTNSPPCLILLDLMMPVMNGWQFRDHQQLDPALASIPVVVVSADGNVREKASSMGAVGYLQKPVDFDQLLDTVKRLC